jgi:hypothetical protein
VLAHEPVERLRFGRRQPFEATDDDDVERLERDAGERCRVAAAGCDRFFHWLWGPTPTAT